MPDHVLEYLYLFFAAEVQGQSEPDLCFLVTFILPLRQQYKGEKE